MFPGTLPCRLVFGTLIGGGDDRLALCGKSDCEFEFVIDDLFDGNLCEASIGEQDGERRFVFIEFVLGNRRMVNQLLNTEPSDPFSLRYS